MGCGPILSKNTNGLWEQLRRNGRRGCGLVKCVSNDIGKSMEEEGIVRGLIDRLATAEREGDVPFLKEKLAHGFVAIGPRGFMLTKDEWLARHASGDLKYPGLRVEEVIVRWPGPDTAIVTGREVPSSTYKGNTRPESEMRLMAVLVDQWEGGDGPIGLLGREKKKLATGGEAAEPDPCCLSSSSSFFLDLCWRSSALLQLWGVSASLRARSPGRR
jgi:hypothetical protein